MGHAVRQSIIRQSDASYPLRALGPFAKAYATAGLTAPEVGWALLNRMHAQLHVLLSFAVWQRSLLHACDHLMLKMHARLSCQISWPQYRHGLAAVINKSSVGAPVCIQCFDCRQTFATEEVFDKARVAQFVSVTGDANILHADPDDEGSPVQGETSTRLFCRDKLL